MFNTSNWNIGGKGDKHIHFHVEGIPGLSFSDHLMFYNGDDKIVEFNFQNGKNPFASWVNKNTIRLNNLSNGKYKVRAHLATESHQPPGNKEADVIISFIVNVSKEDGLCTINAPLNNLISKERKIDLVINIPKSYEEEEITNDYVIRRKAVDFNIPLLTNAQIVKLFVESISRKKMEDLESLVENTFQKPWFQQSKSWKKII